MTVWVQNRFKCVDCMADGDLQLTAASQRDERGSYRQILDWEKTQNQNSV